MRPFRSRQRLPCYPRTSRFKSVPRCLSRLLYTNFQQPPAANDTRAKSPGVYVATGSRDKTIKLWDTLSGQCLRTFVGHDNWIRALVFHPTGKYLLSASDDKTIKLWDLVNGRCTKTIEAHSHFVTCMTWARAVTGGNKEMPNGDGSARKEARRINVLATGSVDQTIKVGRSSTPFDKSWLTLGRPLYRSGHPSTIIIFFSISITLYFVYIIHPHIYPPGPFSLFILTSIQTVGGFYQPSPSSYAQFRHMSPPFSLQSINIS